MKYCDKNGLQCCHDMNVVSKKCLKPCFGVYADVTKVYEDYKTQFDSWNIISQSYKNFKNMFEANISYPKELHGKSKGSRGLKNESM